MGIFWQNGMRLNGTIFFKFPSRSKEHDWMRQKSNLTHSW
jgi:hypothetical protein